MVRGRTAVRPRSARRSRALISPGDLAVLVSRLSGLGLRARGIVVGEEPPSAVASGAPQPARCADDHEHDAELERERRRPAKPIREEQVERDEGGEEKDESDGGAHEVTCDQASRRGVVRRDEPVLVMILGGFREKYNDSCLRICMDRPRARSCAGADSA